MIKINVHTDTNVTIAFNRDPTDTVQFVKAFLCQHEKVPIPAQRFFGNGRYMHDEMMLQHYAVDGYLTIKLQRLYDPITVCFKWRTACPGMMVHVRVCKSETVLSVKTLLFHMFNLVIERMNFVHNDVHMEDGETLSAYGVRHESQIDLDYDSQ